MTANKFLHKLLVYFCVHVVGPELQRASAILLLSQEAPSEIGQRLCNHIAVMDISVLGDLC